VKVLYDHQIFDHQRIGGVSRYFTEIIRHLPSEIDCEVSIQYSFNEYLKSLDIPFIWKYQLLSYAEFLPDWNFKGKKRLFNLLANKFPNKFPDLLEINKEATIKMLQAKDFDIFHPTFFQDYYLPYMGNKPYILTVHDMIIELYPEFINSPGFVKRKKKLVDQAAHIIAVSENTKRDIINVFGTSDQKISVVHHASSLEESNEKPENLPERYILYVGDRRLGYKNFSFFVSSIQPILSKNKDLYLVCTGDKFTEDEVKFFKELGISEQIIIRFVEDRQMYGLYESAQVFVYPSYYEGFGIPVLEAFQAKCPIVLPNSSCFPEVAADAGIYFNAKSPQELRNAILKILEDKEYRAEMIQKGTERLQDFSWKTSALQTVDIYKKVLGIG